MVAIHEGGLACEDPHGDEALGYTAHAALVPREFELAIRVAMRPPDLSPCLMTLMTVLHWRLPAVTRYGKLTRRAFLRVTAACPLLLTTLAPMVRLPNSFVGADAWGDGSFWVDGTGWV